MAQAVLKCNGMIVPRLIYRPLTVEEIESKNVKRVRDDFDISIRDKLGDSIDISDNDDINTFDKKGLMVDEDSEVPDIVDRDPVDNNGIPILEQPYK